MSSTISGTPCYGWQLTDVMTRIVNRYNDVSAGGGSTDTWESMGFSEWVVSSSAGDIAIGYTPSSSDADGSLISLGDITTIRDGLEALYLAGVNPGYYWQALPADFTTEPPLGLTGSTTSVYARSIGAAWTGGDTWVHVSELSGGTVYDVDYLELTACLSWMEASALA